MVKFTGKERDAETGLDYFGARYFSGAQGRFTSVDPAMESQDPSNPQSWNRYAYTYNNPLKFVDRNGKWPTYIHNELIASAFPGLSSQERLILIGASRDTDFNRRVNGRLPQEPVNSFVHGMSDGTRNQSPEAAERLSNEFIERSEGRAGELQAAYVEAGGAGLASGALAEFGTGLHTVMDRTSPSHEGYQAWNGIESLAGLAAGSKHVAQESLGISPERQATAVETMRTEFKKVFGAGAYQRAIKVPEVILPDERKKLDNR